MKSTMISENIKEYRETKKVKYLFIAIIQVIKQGRLVEILYGFYCNLMYRSSKIETNNEAVVKAILDDFKPQWKPDELQLTRNDLVERYGEEFLVESLPNNFVGARTDTIVRYNEFLIVGEYGDGIRVSRIAILTRNTCLINDYYTRYSTIIHIHAIHQIKNSENFLITTGDSSKFLDKWEFVNGNLQFVKRIRKFLAGYTSVIEINGKLYFGTDFSDRPNYIATMKRRKYFFPAQAYKKWVVTFYSVFNRYLISTNRSVLDQGHVLSIFDTQTKKFIYCDEIDF